MIIIMMCIIIITSLSLYTSRLTFIRCGAHEKFLRMLFLV